MAENLIFKALTDTQKSEMQSKFDSYCGGSLSAEAFVGWAKKSAKDFVVKAAAESVGS